MHHRNNNKCHVSAGGDPKDIFVVVIIIVVILLGSERQEEQRTDRVASTRLGSGTQTVTPPSLPQVDGALLGTMMTGSADLQPAGSSHPLSGPGDFPRGGGRGAACRAPFTLLW